MHHAAKFGDCGTYHDQTTINFIHQCRPKVRGSILELIFVSFSAIIKPDSPTRAEPLWQPAKCYPESYKHSELASAKYWKSSDDKQL